MSAEKGEGSAGREDREATREKERMKEAFREFLVLEEIPAFQALISATRSRATTKEKEDS